MLLLRGLLGETFPRCVPTLSLEQRLLILLALVLFQQAKLLQHHRIGIGVAAGLDQLADLGLVQVERDSHGCSMWLQSMIGKVSMAGSTGDVS